MTATEQRDMVLEHANSIRVDNAALKRGLRAMSKADACKAAADIVRWPVDHEEALRVGHLVQAVPGVGPVKFGSWAARNRVAEHRKVRDLTVAQRVAVARWLLEHGRPKRKR